MIRIYIYYKKMVRRLQGWIYQNLALYQLKKANAKYYSDIKFNGKIELQIYGKVEIGKGFICNSSINNCISSGGSKIVVKPNAKLIIKDFSGISNVSLNCYEMIEIGNYVNIGAGTMIYDTNFHSTDWQDRRNREIDIENAKTAPVHIKDYVFIGTNCIIGKGITIGEKAIVAAGSVVIKDIPAGEIWGGNPAKFIKKINE